MSCKNCQPSIDVTVSGGYNMGIPSDKVRNFSASRMRIGPQGHLNLFAGSEPTRLVATVAPGYWKVAEYVEAQATCRCGGHRAGFYLGPE